MLFSKFRDLCQDNIGYGRFRAYGIRIPKPAAIDVVDLIGRKGVTPAGMPRRAGISSNQ